jgi:proteasome activator subunit 4
MLQEWRPLMCPFDVTMAKAMSYLEMFLPTFNTQERRDVTFGLWFDELMAFWKACPNTTVWEPTLFSLFARLAEDTSGHIDWNPYMPMLMTRIQHSMDLPVHYKGLNIGRKALMANSNTFVRWIVATMGGDSEIFTYLEQMFNALESYFHTANHGQHSIKLSEFMYKLATLFVKRIYKERHAKKQHWGSKIPDEKKISDENITRFVGSLMPIVMHGMYSKSGIEVFGSVLQNLAFLRPEIVIPPVIEKVYQAFETLTEPHKLTASMLAAVSMSRSLVVSTPQYREGPTHVIPLLMASLPGIDPNDMRKSMMAFQLISTFCTLVPIVDCSTAGQFYDDLTEEESLICGQTAQFEDFIVAFLDRCFALIECSTLEQTREEVSMSDHRNSREETMKDIGMASTFNAILIHSSEALYMLALRKVQGFIKGRILETKIAGRIASSLCRCLVKARPDKGLPAFVPNACDVINDLLKENGDQDERLDEELKFNMLILSEVLILMRSSNCWIVAKNAHIV